MKITATRRLRFDAGHRVLGHEGKCARPHGHGYEVEVTAEGFDGLDVLGRVVDFSVLKGRLGSWLDAEWDHGFIVYERDSDLLLGLSVIRGAKVYIAAWNPTAENIAAFLLGLAGVLLAGTGVEVVRVRVDETPNCYAEAAR
jgi:6-pyruvoyltetrahydropterin/6-carboxytetrahydropterin synthase